ncbi:MAG: PAS domain S-box protein [Cytophagales bacterium]|nr:PAS domain S-box protein [Cytophagales bacterium]
MTQYPSGTLLLTALQDDPHTLVFVTDLAGKLLETNRGFANATGSPAGPGEKWLWDFLAPGDAEKTKTWFAQATAPHAFSQQWQSPHGVRVQVDWSAYPFAEEPGGPRLLCIGKEASTPRKKTAYASPKEAGMAIRGMAREGAGSYEYEKQLHYKEKLLDSVSEAIVATDVHFNITGWNKGAEQVYGWKAEEVLGKDARTILQTSFREGLDKESVVKELLERGCFRNRVFQRRKDGTLLRIYSNSSRLLDDKNQLLGFVGLNQDIGHLVQLEENLLNYQAQLQIIIDNSPDSIFLTDAEGRLLVKNRTFEKIFFERFGIHPAKGDKLLDITPPELRAFTRENLNRAAEGKPFAFEYSYPDKHGETQTTDTSICPVLDPDGKVSCIVFYSKSITLRKKLEAQTLSDQVEAQKTRAALLVEGQEQERARLIKELHDGIGQMLNVLKLKIDSWLDKPGAQPQELADIAGFTGLIIADIKNLVHDSMPYQLEHLGLAGAIRNLVAQYELQPQLNVRFQVWVNVKDPHFGKGVEVFIYRVVQECLHNAVKHSGGDQITVQLTQLEGELLLMAEDNGGGFDLAEVLRQKQPAAGLRNIMERCNLVGADLEIDTQPGHGCTINIRVPL